MIAVLPELTADDTGVALAALEAGFSRVEELRLEHDIMNAYYVVRP